MLCLYRHFAPNSTMTSSLVLATSVAPMIMNHGSVWSGSLRPPVAIKHGTCGSFRRRLTVTAAIDDDESSRRLITRMETDRKANVVGAMLSGITSMAALAVVYSKFSCQFDDGGDDQFPAVEMLATFSLSVRAAVGTEYWARWAHRALWHRSLWNLHKSHHKARDGPFEANDVFVVTRMRCQRLDCCLLDSSTMALSLISV
ncbi:hypothetical protein LINGRAHAP2_LOCUS3156 [Linum grandiflorum]